MRIGTGGDLKFCHDSTNSYIVNNTGNLNLKIAGTETGISIQPNSCVTMYYDNDVKFKTLTNGTCTYGTHYAGTLNSSDQIKANADVNGEGVVISGSGVTANAHGLVDFVENVTGTFGFQLCMDGGTNQFYIGRKENTATSTKVMCINRASNDVFFAGNPTATCFCGKAFDSDRLDNISSGSFLRSDVADIKTAGNLTFNDNICAVFGTGSDMCMWHDNTNSFIRNSTGNLIICTNANMFLKNGLDTAIYAAANSCVQLYYDNAAKFKTTSVGVCVSGIMEASGNVCATTCVSSAVVCATTAFRTTGVGNRFCGGTGCGTAVDWIATSDCRQKKCIEPYEECGIDKINHLIPVCYNWCHDGTADMGFIAQDVLKVEPLLVAGTEECGYGLKYDKISAITVKAIQELSCEVKELRKEINILKNE